MNIFKLFNADVTKPQIALTGIEAVGFIADNITGTQCLAYLGAVAEDSAKFLDTVHPETKNISSIAKYVNHAMEFSTTIQVPTDMKDTDGKVVRAAVIIIHHLPSLELAVAKDPGTLVAPICVFCLHLDINEEKIVKITRVNDSYVAPFVANNKHVH